MCDFCTYVYVRGTEAWDVMFEHSFLWMAMNFDFKFFLTRIKKIIKHVIFSLVIISCFCLLINVSVSWKSRGITYTWDSKMSFKRVLYCFKYYLHHPYIVICLHNLVTACCYCYEYIRYVSASLFLTSWQRNLFDNSLIFTIRWKFATLGGSWIFVYISSYRRFIPIWWGRSLDFLYISFNRRSIR